MATRLLPVVLAYSLQLAIVVAVLWLLLRMLAARAAALRLRAWQAALALAILLPASVFLPVVPLPSNVGGDALLSTSIELWTGGIVVVWWTEWILALLIAGAVLRGGWLVIGWLRFKGRITPQASGDDDVRFADACEAVGVRARLVWRSDIGHPFTCGSAPPVVVVPADLAAEPDATLRAIFLHELMHVRRRDWQSVIVEEAVRAVLWFHPAVWLLLAELRQAREEVIDRATVRLLGSRRSYLDTLVALADRGEPARLSPALPFFRSRQLARRIAALASEASMSKARIMLSSALVLAASMATVAAAARAFPLPAIAAADAGDSAKAQATPRGVKRPVVVDMKKAEYPESAKAKQIQGDVVMDVLIDAQGKVSDVTVVKKLADELDAAATAAIKDSTFRPGLKDGKPVPVKVTITVAFRLK
jgi:D-alanyl-D-alanine endopeptidase (penicillin-binding protein 7)